MEIPKEKDIRKLETPESNGSIADILRLIHQDLLKMNRILELIERR